MSQTMTLISRTKNYDTYDCGRLPLSGARFLRLVYRRDAEARRRRAAERARTKNYEPSKNVLKNHLTVLRKPSPSGSFTQTVEHV
jgi:hypothetical protein